MGRAARRADRGERAARGRDRHDRSSRRSTCCRCSRRSKDIKVVDLNRSARHFAFRFNTLHKPFDDPRIRQAALYALSQKEFLQAGVGNPKYEKECKDLFGCGTPLEHAKGWEDKLNGNVAKSKELLKAAGYDGTPIVLLHATDLRRPA